MIYKRKSCNIISFIIHVFHILISYIENTFDIWIYWKMQNSCDICSFISWYFICQHIYLCVKCVFNAWYSCVICMNLWMNEFAWFSLLICHMLNLWCRSESSMFLRGYPNHVLTLLLKTWYMNKVLGLNPISVLMPIVHKSRM